MLHLGEVPMRPAGACLLVLILVNPSSPLRADETYALKFKEYAKDLLVDSMVHDTMKMELADEKGRLLLSQEQDKTTTCSYRGTILEQPEGQKATRIRRIYSKAEIRSKGDTSKLAYANQTVMIERKGEKYCFFLGDGKELKGKDAELLDKEFNGEDPSGFDIWAALLPAKPASVGTTWEVKTGSLAKLVSRPGAMVFKEDGPAGVGKLRRVFTQDGHQFGTLDFKVELPAEAIGVAGPDGMKWSIQPGANLQLEIVRTGCIDASVFDNTINHETKLDLTATAKAGENKEWKITFTGKGSRELSKREPPKD
jgi:hypothetical protein